MGGSIPKPAQISEAVGHGSEGVRKDSRNGAGPRSDVQGGGAFGSIIWQRDISDDQGYAKDPDGIKPSVSVKYNGDDGETQGRRRVGGPISRVGNGRCRAPPHWGLHQEATYDHRGEVGLPTRLCTVNEGGADAENKPVGVLVGSRRGK